MNGNNINSYSRFLCKLLVCGLSYSRTIQTSEYNGVPFIVSVAKICVDLDAISLNKDDVQFYGIQNFLGKLNTMLLMLLYLEEGVLFRIFRIEM